MRHGALRRQLLRVGRFCIASACCPSAQACGKACCDASSQCVVDETGTPSCATNCRKSSDCNAVTPCCEALDNGQGGFSGSGVCAASGGNYQCLCFSSSECSFLGDEECVPAVNMAGAIIGPYVCAANDGNSHHGCNNKVACSTTDEFCANDQLGNDYCAIACIMDEDYTCGNTGVACCNMPCTNTEGNLCCGLCRDGG